MSEQDHLDHTLFMNKMNKSVEELKTTFEKFHRLDDESRACFEEAIDLHSSIRSSCENFFGKFLNDNSPYKAYKDSDYYKKLVNCYQALVQTIDDLDPENNE